jgi:predicted metal-binding membrane protein
MQIFMSLYLAALFVAFVPGVLVTLPPRSGRSVVLAVHAALFVLVWHFTNKMVFRMLYEGFQNNNMAVNTNNSGVAMNNNGNANNSGNGMNKMANSTQ